MKIGIFYKDENSSIIEKIKKEASKRGITFDNKSPDIVFSVGGDGTFLRAVHEYIEHLDTIEFIGINSGSLGFFYDFTENDISHIFDLLCEKKYHSKKHLLLKGVATFKNSTETIYALNEIKIENPFHTFICKVLINKEELETFRGNGLIVSSTLGSSAYNKSLGGALIDSDLNVLELTEIAGISNNIYRSLDSSLVIKGDKVITFSGEMSKAVIGYDHLDITKDNPLTKLEVCYSDKTVKIIYSENHSYINKIRKSFVL